MGRAWRGVRAQEGEEGCVFVRGTGRCSLDGGDEGFGGGEGRGGVCVGWELTASVGPLMSLKW